MSSEQWFDAAAFEVLNDLGPDAFRQLFETAPDAVVIVDEQGRIVLASRQVQRLFGYTPQQLQSMEVEALMPVRFRRAHGGHRQAFLRNRQTRPMGSGLELWALRHNGEEFPVEISLSPVQVAGKVYVSASIRDVTDRRHLEAETKRLQQYLLSALDSIEGSFFIWDARDQLVLCNSAARALWSNGLSGEILGRSWRELLDANLQAGVVEFEGRSLEELRERLLEYHRAPVGMLRAKTRSGRHIRLLERRTPEGGTVGLITDVTEDVQREEELRRSRAAAEAASAAKSEFLSSMSHELRTPMNAILGFAQLLQRDKKEPLSARHQERLAHVIRGGEHLLHLIDDVLDLARIEAGRIAVSIEPVHVDEVLREVASATEAVAERAGMSVKLDELAVELPKVLADRTRFKQVLMNYLSNALKYGRAGGHVLVKAQRHDDRVRATIIDDGPGIAGDKQAKLFEPFHRAGQEAGPIEGTGIGLAICKRLAQVMNGSVGFTSTEGQGSSFWIELPICEPASVPVTSAATRPNPLKRDWLQRHRVLYVEDNPTNVAFMKDLLDDFEHVELLVAATAERGIELARLRRPSVIIMDIHLPGMSGIEARQRLQQRPETCAIPVVALSAAAMVGEARRIEQAGFSHYLTKPVRVDELTAVLDELLEQASVISGL